MKKSSLACMLGIVMFVCSGCGGTTGIPNQSPTTTEAQTTTHTSSVQASPASPINAGGYSGFSRVSFGRVGGNIRPYTITIVSPGVKPNKDLENGQILSDYPSNCIKKNQKVTMKQLITLDAFFAEQTFWDLPNTIGSNLANPDSAKRFIDIDSDAGKKRIDKLSGGSDLFDTIFQKLTSFTTHDACSL